jgi:hypothetical protein
MTPGRFAVVVMDRGQPDGWRERFLGQLAQGATTMRGEPLGRGAVTLAGDQLHLDGEWVGAARFEPVEWADGPLRDWIRQGTRPFVGAPAGLFVWSHLLAPDASDLVETVARTARGAGYRLDTHELREHVVRRRFALTNLTSAYGFEEGRALLERQPCSYIDDAVSEIKRALASKEIDVWAGFDGNAAGNNPLRIYPPMEVAGERVPDERIDDVLHPLGIEIWAFREKLGFPNDEFWIDADP